MSRKQNNTTSKRVILPVEAPTSHKEIAMQVNRIAATQESLIVMMTQYNAALMAGNAELAASYLKMVKDDLNFIASVAQAGLATATSLVDLTVDGVRHLDTVKGR